MWRVSDDVVGEEFCSRLDIELCDRREESMEVLKNIHMLGKLQIFAACRCRRRLKYLCLQGNALQNPWEAITEKFPSVIHLDLRRNRIVYPVPGLGNRATSFCRVDVDLDDERWMKSLKDYCPGLTHVGAIPVFPAEAATTLEDEDVSDSEDDKNSEGCCEWSESDDGFGCWSEASDDMSSWRWLFDI
ncbi:unnamed protein product [Heligmosomoides polygyrus]|uniref:LRRcap domain-containing protein n=1 Tax=Heligmosomoides polygyrus TaxID=6339 RepID=A0A183GBB1_HELPZ|nr:unnamed protein product [Heligmosomoides polygyrus]